MLIVSLIILFTLLILIVCWRIYRLTGSTSGPQISIQADRSALLVIDMQEGIINQPHYRAKKELISAIQHIINEASPQLEVIYIQHSITRHPIDTLLTAGQMQTGMPETNLIEELANDSLTLFQKHRADAFSNPDFDAYLRKRQIHQLYMVGADASGCVYRTALGGKKRGYDVTILEDGLFATSQKSKDKMLVSYQRQGIQIDTNPF